MTPGSESSLSTPCNGFKDKVEIEEATPWHLTAFQLHVMDSKRIYVESPIDSVIKLSTPCNGFSAHTSYRGWPRLYIPFNSM